MGPSETGLSHTSSKKFPYVKLLSRSLPNPTATSSQDDVAPRFAEQDRDVPVSQTQVAIVEHSEATSVQQRAVEQPVVVILPQRDPQRILAKAALWNEGPLESESNALSGGASAESARGHENDKLVTKELTTLGSIKPKKLNTAVPPESVHSVRIGGSILFSFFAYSLSALVFLGAYTREAKAMSMKELATVKSETKLRPKVGEASMRHHTRPHGRATLRLWKQSIGKMS